MIIFALAAAAAMQWTGPRTEEYRGPGHFCGGGYAVSLARGDRALVLPQDTGGQAVRFVLGGREVNVRSGARREPGRPVMSYRGGTSVMEQRDGGGVAYIVADQTNFALRVTSDAFRGFPRDRWFFSHANFADRADEGVSCLSAYSY
jgi:hypothetical protein